MFFIGFKLYLISNLKTLKNHEALGFIECFFLIEYSVIKLHIKYNICLYIRYISYNEVCFCWQIVFFISKNYIKGTKNMTEAVNR